MVKFIKKYYVYICIAVCFLVMLWRAFMGFCWTDESFYVSTADRFYKGDLPLVGEWYRTQMSSIIMLPLYWAYMLIAGSNTGVILYFRLLYLALTLLISIVYYRVLRKEYPEYVSGASALFILCFAHLNMATFSYYMMSNIFLAFALILIYDYKNRQVRIKLVAAGILIALSVMSMPAFVAGYVPVMVAVFAAIAISKIKKVPVKVRDEIASWRLWDISLYTIAGIAIPAILFIVYIFSHMSLDYLIETLPYVLVDNEHSNTLGYFIRKPHRCLVDVFGMFTWVSYAFIAVTFVFQKRLKKHPLCEITVFLDVCLFAVLAYMSFGHVGYISVAFFVFILPVYFVSEKKNHSLFILMAVPAALVALIYCFASSDFLYIMALGFAIATSAGICAVYDFAEGNLKTAEPSKGKMAGTASALAGCVCAVMLAVTFILRIVNVYRDAPLDRLDSLIPDGIAKGIFTTQEHLEQYTDIYEVIDEYCSGTEGFEVISGNPNGNVLFSKVLPWGYAAASLNCGYPTTWRSTSYSKEQLDIYYDINKTSLPDVIIVLDSRYGSYDACGDVEDDHEPNLDELPDHWRDYISRNGFDEIKVKCGSVYCRKK